MISSKNSLRTFYLKLGCISLSNTQSGRCSESFMKVSFITFHELLSRGVSKLRDGIDNGVGSVLVS